MPLNTQKEIRIQQSTTSINKEKKEIDMIETHKYTQCIFSQQNTLTVSNIIFKTCSMKAQTNITINNIEAIIQNYLTINQGRNNNHFNFLSSLEKMKAKSW